jgi:hypothetical protein
LSKVRSRMIFALMITVVVACVAWSLWVRRPTWRYPQQSGTTASVALLGATALLLSPLAAATLGRALHGLTGQWYLDDLLGHACAVGAAAAIAQTALIRCADNRTAEAMLRRWVEFPAVLSFPLLLATFTLSEVPDAEHRAADYFFEVPADVWLGVHRLIFNALMIYLFAYIIHLMVILRRDERSRCTADIFIVSAAFGVLACLTRIVTILYPPLLTVETVRLGPLGACACACGLGVAVASGRSWHAKTRP